MPELVAFECQWFVPGAGFRWLTDPRGDQWLVPAGGPDVPAAPAKRTYPLRDEPDLEFPEFYGVFIDNRLAIVYTPYDLMSGVNRESNAYAKGVTNADATRIIINLIVYALSN